MWGYGHDFGMMGGWGGGLFGMFIWPLLLIALIVAAIWSFRSRSGRDAGPVDRPQRSAALDILEQRYARGEINRDEFLRMKQEIAG